MKSPDDSSLEIKVLKQPFLSIHVNNFSFVKRSCLYTRSRNSVCMHGPKDISCEKKTYLGHLTGRFVFFAHWFRVVRLSVDQ